MSRHLNIVAFAALCAMIICCGRAPADPDDGTWPPSQSGGPPAPGEDARRPPSKTGTIGSMVSITVVDKLQGERTSTSLLVRGGRAHATYWRCTLPCYQCQVPLPDPLPPCSGHRYAAWTPDSGPASREHIGSEGGMSTSLWLAPGGQPRASSAALSDVLISSRDPGSTWTSARIPGPHDSWLPRTWAARGPTPHVAWTANGAKGQRELWRSVQGPAGWKTSRHGTVYADLIAAFDGAARMHLIQTTTIHAIEDTQRLQYHAPQQKPWTVTTSKARTLKVEALVLDARRAAHLLYTSRKRISMAQWEPVELWYATNRSGSWAHQRLHAAPGYPGYFSPARLALALDSRQQPHVAVNGAAWSGHKSSPGVRWPLLVGVVREGHWRFVQLDDHATGALDVAVDKERVYVAYFGATDFRLARADIY